MDPVNVSAELESVAFAVPEIIGGTGVPKNFGQLLLDMPLFKIAQGR